MIFVASIPLMPVISMSIRTMSGLLFFMSCARLLQLEKDPVQLKPSVPFRIASKDSLTNLLSSKMATLINMLYIMMLMSGFFTAFDLLQLGDSE